MSLLDEKVIQSKEVKKLIDFLVKESKVNLENIKEMGCLEFRIIVHEDGLACAHVLGRDSSTVHFKLHM